MNHTCSGCDNTWTGLARCHCSSCHETFDNPALFDSHRKNGRCMKPVDLRMTWDHVSRSGLLEGP